MLAFESVVYNEIFNGYSAATHPDGELLARYLHLFVHSDVWIYYLLVTSPEFGAERRRSRKADLENCPILPLEKLSANQRERVWYLSRRLEAGAAVPWADIDAFFARLYGLNEYDLQVIQDTLSVALPYETARLRACASPTEAEKGAFIASLRKSLAPFVATDHGKSLLGPLKVPTTENQSVSPFEVLLLTSSERPPAEIGALADGVLETILSVADETGATQIVLSDPAGLVVGIYNQYRYWTLSRARLLSGDIIRQYLDVITG